MSRPKRPRSCSFWLDHGYSAGHWCVLVFVYSDNIAGPDIFTTFTHYRQPRPPPPLIHSWLDQYFEMYGVRMWLVHVGCDCLVPLVNPCDHPLLKVLNYFCFEQILIAFFFLRAISHDKWTVLLVCAVSCGVHCILMFCDLYDIVSPMWRRKCWSDMLWLKLFCFIHHFMVLYFSPRAYLLQMPILRTLLFRLMVPIVVVQSIIIYCLRIFRFLVVFIFYCCFSLFYVWCVFWI